MHIGKYNWKLGVTLEGGVSGYMSAAELAPGGVCCSRPSSGGTSSVCGYVEGAGEQEALSAVAVLVLSRESSCWLLDALGERLDREGLAELHEGVDERLALLVVLQSVR